MKMPIRCLFAALAVASAACSVPAPTAPSVTEDAPSRDQIPATTQSDTTPARGQNVFGSGN
jgi:hypothetical protein